MRSFLVNINKNSPYYKKPLCPWGSLAPNTYYEGLVPQGYALAINPSENIIIIDVDVDDEKGKFGFDNIPGYPYLDRTPPKHIKYNIFFELEQTYHYNTKRGGCHYWCKYTGDKVLMNKASKYNIDLRIGHKESNNGGYAIYYPANQGDDIRNHLHEIKDTSIELNKWLEELFTWNY